MPAITRSSSNRQQNITNTNTTNTNTNNPVAVAAVAAVAALPLTTPNVPTVPVPPMAPKAPLKKLSHDLESKSSELGYCCICCDEITCEKGRFVLDCGHTFHGNCILRSFKHNNRCPMCRAQVDAAPESSLDYLFPSALRINSSIISTAADHFINDMGNITVANVIHRMLLMSSDNPDMRSIQIPYIKRILVQFATVFITGIAFSVRDGERDLQEPVPIDIVNDENPLRPEDEYDAAISNPAIDAAVSYESIISADMNFDVSQPDNVGAILIRRAIALSELGSQRADLGHRRAARADSRRQQMLMVQQHLRTEMLRRQAIAEQQPEQQQNVGINVDVNVNVANSDDETVIMEEHQEQENPWGPQF